MKINMLVWSSLRNPYVCGRDLKRLCVSLGRIGHDARFFNSDEVAEDMADTHSKSLFEQLGGPAEDRRRVDDCDLMLVFLDVLPRYGGMVGKWEIPAIKAVNGFDGPVIIWENDSSAWPSWRMITGKRFDLRLERPVWAADCTPEIPKKIADSDADVLGYMVINTSWEAIDCAIKDDPRLADPERELMKPEHGLIYGGVVRDGRFKKELRGLMDLFADEDPLSYGACAEVLGFKNAFGVRKNGHPRLVPVKELIQMNSKCRFTVLPDDAKKNYVTSRALESGISDCLVLCGKTYNQEDLGFPVVDLENMDEVRKWKDMDEDLRVEMVKDQHRRMAAIDGPSRTDDMMRNMLDTVFGKGTADSGKPTK